MTTLNILNTAEGATVGAAAGTRALTLGLNNVTGGTFTDAEATSLTIDGSGKKSTGVTVSAAKATSLTVTGDVSVALAGGTLTKVKTITVTNTAGADLDGLGDLDAIDAALVFTGGAGDDKVKFGSTGTKDADLGAGDDQLTLSGSALGAKVNAGDGDKDVLVMTGALAATATGGSTALANKISGFEQLKLTTSGGTVDLANLDAINYVTLTSAANTAITLNNMLSGATVALTVANSNNVTVALSDATPTTDVLELMISGGVGYITGTVTSTGFETVNVTTDDTQAVATGIQFTINTLANVDLTTLVVKGDAGLTVTNAHTGTKLTSLDASGVTKGFVSFSTGALAGAASLTGGAGNDVLNAGSALKAVTLVGNAGDDKLTGSAVEANSLSGGAGDDILTGGAKAETLIDGGAGTDTFVFSSAGIVEQFGTSTTNGVVINLGATAISQADIFAATTDYLAGDGSSSVAANTAAYLYSGLNTGEATVVDTLVSIENITGTDKADYLVGSAGDNVITGGAGIDIVVGGAGKDTYNYADTALAANAMNVKEFVTADDTFQFDAATFAAAAGNGTVGTKAVIGGLGGGAGVAAQYILVDTAANVATDYSTEFGGAAIAFETDTGKILYDLDGDFTGGSITIGTISTVTGTFTDADFLFV